MKNSRPKKSKIEQFENQEIADLLHDIRTPLSVIEGFIESMCRGDEFGEYHGAARRSVKKLITLIEDYGFVSKSSGQTAGFCDVASAVSGAVDCARPYAFERGVELRYVGPQKLYAPIDTSAVDRLVTNLISNSIDASQLGCEVRVELSARDDSLFIEISDNGSGIDDDHKDDIFERGFTFDKETGFGLGLSICERVARELGGSINFTSRKGTGTTFLFSLEGTPVFLPPAGDNPLTPFYGPLAVIPGREDTLD